MIYAKVRYLVCIAFQLVQCKKAKGTPTCLVTEKAMVVSAREEASKIGVDILKKRDNAFEAIVATELALAELEISELKLWFRFIPKAANILAKQIKQTYFT